MSESFEAYVKHNPEFPYRTLAEVARFSPVVAMCLKAGYTAEEVAVVLAHQMSKVMSELVDLSYQVPRKYVGPSGKTVVWQMPIDQIPARRLDNDPI